MAEKDYKNALPIGTILNGQMVDETTVTVKVPVYPDYILELAPDKISIHFWEKSERNSLDWKY